MKPWIVLGGVVGLVLVVLIGVVCFYDAMPGTFYRDKNGFAHGTGRYTYHYKSGALELIEDYYRGKGVRSEWFRPDGTSILVTEWKDESGVGLYLREDGSIRVRMTYVKGISKGPATYYARDGTVLGEAVYEEGGRRVISGHWPAPSDKDD